MLVGTIWCVYQSLESTKYDQYSELELNDGEKTRVWLEFIAEENKRMEEEITNLQALLKALVIYFFHHLIFVLWKIPLYLVFSCVTACHESEDLTNDEYGVRVDQPKFRDCIISNEYIEW